MPAEHSNAEILDALARQAEPLRRHAQRLHEERSERTALAAQLLVARLDVVRDLVSWIGPYTKTEGGNGDQRLRESLFSLEEVLEAVASALFSEDAARIAEVSRLLSDRIDYVFSHRKIVLGRTPPGHADSTREAFEEQRQSLAAIRELDAKWMHRFGAEVRFPGSAVGASTDRDMGVEYARLARNEGQFGLVWAFATLGTIVGLGVVGVWTYAADPETWLDFIRRLVVALPLIAFLPYSISESRDHREHSRWARRIALQLVTLDPFTRRLPTEERGKLIAAFGASLYQVDRVAGPLVASDDATHSASPVGEALQLTERTAGLLRKVRGADTP